MKAAIEDWGAPVINPKSLVSVGSDYESKIAALKEGLLSYDGELFCEPKGGEDDIDALLKRGLMYTPEDMLLDTMPGEPHQCHSNSAACWDANQQTCLIVTGYALFDDRWLQHSWVMTGDDNNEPTIVETTIPANAYFGFVLSQVECQRFMDQNYWM